MNADKKELFDLCSSFFIRDDYSLWAIHLTGRRSRGSHVGRAPSPAAGPVSYTHLAAAAALRPPRWWSVATGAIALCVTAGVLLPQWGLVSRIATRIAPALDCPPAQAGSVGLIVGPPKALPEGLAFDPYLWSAAHYFRRSGAILANAPWMDLPILMMRPAHPSRWSYLDPDDAAQAMADAMAGGQALPDLDFVVREGPADFEMDAMLNRMGWSNSTGNSEFLRVFRRHR